ncbi:MULTISPECIES: hypothetical protein [Bacillaceae]|uniref:Uncharacterized protein n=1 Tax=Evansella alkalicola TaxID=745819 RepID=A0ABS6JTT8_9BACI|nr:MULTISPECIES: hypothetical protein [Bacillaceae]MBU9720555.1 hypothetical protein [Bacillus alkalicola]
MAEILQEGYSDLRTYIESNWQYIELQNDEGNSIVRLSPTDSRVQWTHSTGDQVLKLQVVVKGSDSDIASETTFGQSAIYKTSSGGNPISVESFTPFTIESEDDELTVIHSIEVPKV